MRGACVLVVLVAAAAAAHAEPWLFPDEDDPKLARAEVHAAWWTRPHDVPRFKLAYRRVWAASLEGPDLPFDVAELDFYPLSRLVRLGIAGELGEGGRFGRGGALEVGVETGGEVDIVLMDVNMPGMNGIELAKLVRDTCSNTKILLLSGQAAVSDLLRQARESGYSFELLAKPLHPDDLIEKLRG